MAHAHLWSSCRQGSESPLLVHPKTMVSCLLGSSRLLPRLLPRLPWLAVAHQPPSGCIHAANPSPLPGIWPPKPKLSSQPPPTPVVEQTSLSGWWVLVGTNPLCGNLSTLPSALLMLCSPPWLWSFPTHPPPYLHQWRDFLVWGNFSSFTAPSQKCRSRLYSFCLFFLFSFALPRYMRSFLPFGKSEFFCQHSVVVL